MFFPFASINNNALIIFYQCLQRGEDTNSRGSNHSSISTLIQAKMQKIKSSWGRKWKSVSEPFLEKKNSHPLPD